MEQNNEILNYWKKNHDHIYLSEYGITINDRKIFANQFNSYFVTAAKKLVYEFGENNSKYKD